MSKPISLEHGRYYHIYNRGTNRENVFIEPRNYSHFLHLYAQYITPIADTFAYCLLRNHFHILLRIKTAEELQIPLVGGLGQVFSNFFNAYAKAFNVAYQRTGSLFQHPFGRKVVDTDRYFNQLVVYIHQNPQRHQLIDDFREWTHSSYATMLSSVATRLQRTETLSWFGDRAGFCSAHDMPAIEKDILALVEDDLL